MNKLFKSLCCVLTVIFLTECFTLFSGASTGFTEVVFISVSHNPGGSTKYVILCRSELEDYAASGSVSIRASGGTFDSRGETFQICFDCYASHIEYRDGKELTEEMTPSRTVASFTADENTDAVRLESGSTEYEKITLFSGNMQYIRHIEADGDCNTVASIVSTGFFADMYQFYNK